jgi:Transposase DDE domain
VAALQAQNRPALIADTQMRKRDERLAGQAKHQAKADPLHNKQSNPDKPKLFGPGDSKVDAETNRCVCPAGKLMYSNGTNAKANGYRHYKFTWTKGSCVPCKLRDECMRDPQRTEVKQVAIFYKNQPS